MDGAAEWMAVSLELPQESYGSQLACLLLCKGVLKLQVGVTKLLAVTQINSSLFRAGMGLSSFKPCSPFFMRLLLVEILGGRGGGIRCFIKLDEVFK